MRLNVMFFGFLLASAMPAIACAQEIELAPGQTLLQLSATGSAEVKADIATLSAGITTTGRTAREAIDANSRVAEGIIAALRSQGVEKRDVQTQTISVSPQFAEVNYPPRPADGGASADIMPQEPRITGYIANNQLQIRIRNLEKASDLVDDLFEAGANNVYGPSFGLDNREAAMRAARQDAIRRMQTQASEYAAALGKKMVALTAVSDRGSSGIVYDRPITVTAMRRTSNMPAPPPPPPVPVETGSLQITTSVWGDYILSD